LPPPDYRARLIAHNLLALAAVLNKCAVDTQSAGCARPPVRAADAYGIQYRRRRSGLGRDHGVVDSRHRAHCYGSDVPGMLVGFNERHGSLMPSTSAFLPSTWTAACPPPWIYLALLICNMHACRSSWLRSCRSHGTAASTQSDAVTHARKDGHAAVEYGASSSCRRSRRGDLEP
jgi:hypothetical protein